MTYRFLPLAKRAYLDILWWYEVNAGSEVTDLLWARFTASFVKIDAGLTIGSRRPDWLGDPWRFTLEDPYWIIWCRTDPSRVEIGHLLHARRDIARLLDALR